MAIFVFMYIFLFIVCKCTVAGCIELPKGINKVFIIIIITIIMNDSND